MVQSAMARERLFALRETIARLENRKVPSLEAENLGQDNGAEKPCPVLPFGIAPLDAALQGGLPLSGLMEVRAQETRDAGTAMGFALALTILVQDNRDGERQDAISPVLWIGQGMAAPEAGLPYGRGLQAYGLDPRVFVFSTPRSLEDALWIAEAALSVPAFAAVILEVRGNPAHFGLGESRRLHLRALSRSIPLFVLRQAGEEEASSALLRFLVRPAPSAHRFLPSGKALSGSIGNPVFHVTIEKSRHPSPAEFSLEWSSDGHRFTPVGFDAAQPSDRQPAHPRPHLPASAGRQGDATEMGRLLAFQRAS